MLKDIRETETAEYGETLRQRWGALLSYRYIGRQFSAMNNVSDDTVTVRHDMRNAAGGILAQVFSISAPGGGGPSDLEVVPNPVIHSLQVLDNGNDVQRIEVIKSEALKVGARMYFGRAVIADADAHDRVLALIEGQGVSLGDAPPGAATSSTTTRSSTSRIRPTFPRSGRSSAGTSATTGDGRCPSCKRSSHHPMLRCTSVRSSSSTRPPPSTSPPSSPGATNCNLRPTTSCSSRGKVGPFRVDGRALRGADSSGRIGVQLTLHDEGNGDRAVSAASMTFRTVD